MPCWSGFQLGMGSTPCPLPRGTALAPCAHEHPLALADKTLVLWVWGNPEHGLFQRTTVPVLEVRVQKMVYVMGYHFEGLRSAFLHVLLPCQSGLINMAFCDSL